MRLGSTLRRCRSPRGWPRWRRRPAGSARPGRRGGEDYELLACVPGERLEAAARAIAALGTPATPIGSVERGLGAEISRSDGRTLKPDGFDQLG